MMIYLYLKTHKKTGLRYLGKTTQDPYVYKGSGLRWKRHLAKHGNDVDTLILLETEDPSEIKKMGEHYSTLWDVVDSQSFANLKPESGDGGDMSMCESFKNSVALRDVSGERNGMYGRSAVTENKLRWYNNGETNVYVPEGTAPSGYCNGRIITFRTPLTEETKKKISQSNKKPDRACISPNGTFFTSLKLAGESIGISAAGIRESIKRGKSGWKWA